MVLLGGSLISLIQIDWDLRSDMVNPLIANEAMAVIHRTVVPLRSPDFNLSSAQCLGSMNLHFDV